MSLKTCGLVTLAVLGALLGLALEIAYITIGSMYIHDCPLAPMIPIYLVVAGVTSILLQCIGGAHKINTPGMIYPSSILSLFCFIWLIYGSYHVYSIYPPNYQMNTTKEETTGHFLNRLEASQAQAVGSQFGYGGPHCDRTLYLFAFWNITLVYVLGGAGLLISGCVYGCTKLMK